MYFSVLFCTFFKSATKLQKSFVCGEFFMIFFFRKGKSGAVPLKYINYGSLIFLALRYFVVVF
jgi:hypothetical protein